jgi:pyruvate/2-oxoglutarate dehydrogenase complex dihydrolipoamide dehydrogenase (E3) component
MMQTNTPSHNRLTANEEAERRRRDQALDSALEMTFPASDPIAVAPTSEQRTLDSAETVMSSEHFENVVLGGGEAGKYIAWELARAGRRTAVIERALVGGSCPNIACMPSKNVIRSAKVADLVRHAAEFGVPTGPWITDMDAVRQRKREMVDSLIGIHRTRFAANGLEFILGEGRFVAPRTIEVRLAEGGTRRLEGERVFLNLGTRATIPDIPAWPLPRHSPTLRRSTSTGFPRIW